MTSTPIQSADHIAAAAGLESLQSSARMPVLFIGHGSPLNAVGDNPYRRVWGELGQGLLSQFARPQLILCISAHWLTRNDWELTGMAQPPTIHDFGGLPQVLFEQEYPAPGSPSVARELASRLNAPDAQRPVTVDESHWGFDHGTWSVLKPMFPAADIPVIQLSLLYKMDPQEHFAIGQQLRALRDQGVLIIGSGNIVHNLHMLQLSAPPNQAFDWAIEFDQAMTRHIESGDLQSLTRFQDMGRTAQLAHPTHEHYLPLLHAAGAVHEGEQPRFFNTDYQFASTSMRSVIWGA